jgi:hypothetical protein
MANDNIERGTFWLSAHAGPSGWSYEMGSPYVHQEQVYSVPSLKEYESISLQEIEGFDYTQMAQDVLRTLEEQYPQRK